MTASASERPVSRKRRPPPGLIVAVLIGGIIFAVIDAMAVTRGLMIASDLASPFGETVQPIKITVTWFYGLLSIGRPPENVGRCRWIMREHFTERSVSSSFALLSGRFERQKRSPEALTLDPTLAAWTWTTKKKAIHRRKVGSYSHSHASPCLTRSPTCVTMPK